jgi:broad specificity phosphatase PhoE
MTDVFLCRHGRTPLNVAGLLRGRLDPPLDLVGRAEARDLARELAGVGLVRVISSPLARAVQTAQPIAEAAGLDLETDPRLLDRDYGRFDGQSADDVSKEYGSLDAAPGVESVQSVADRATAALADLVAGDDESAVAVVSHDAVIRIVLDRLAPGHTGHVQPRTGCWSLLRHDGSGWQLLAVNSKDDPIETAFAQRPLRTGGRP